MADTLLICFILTTPTSTKAPRPITFQTSKSSFYSIKDFTVTGLIKTERKLLFPSDQKSKKILTPQNKYISLFCVYICEGYIITKNKTVKTVISPSQYTYFTERVYIQAGIKPLDSG